MAKEILLGADAKKALRDGMNEVAEAVGCTLGPRGKTVVIKDLYGFPHVTKDGVSVAKAIELKDPVKNAGAMMIREVAQKTVEAAGDGTTTATVLAQAIFNDGFKIISAGANPAAIKRGIEKAVTAIVGATNGTEKVPGALDAISTQVTDEKISQVGTISANGDREIGELLRRAMSKVGTDGLITIDDANSTISSLEVVEGMRFDRGWISPNFVTHPDRREAVLEAKDGQFVYVLVVDKKMSSLSDIRPFFQSADALQKDTRPFLLIADNIEGEVLNALLINKVKGILSCCAVQGPGFADRREHMLQDIAILTGATVISEKFGKSLDDIALADLGKAKRIVIGKDYTSIIGGMGDPQKIKDRVAELRSAIASADNDFDREKLRERLAKLSRGAAIIRVGATTETELKEKKDRAEDALYATRAAVEEGIVPGGGTALIRCRYAVEALLPQLDTEERMGAEIILRSLSAPLKKIAENSGLGSAAVTIRDVENFSDINYGFNAATGQMEDLVLSGVIDPTKVVRVALQNAASVAGLLLTTDALLVEIPEPHPTIMAMAQPNY